MHGIFEKNQEISTGNPQAFIVTHILYRFLISHILLRAENCHATLSYFPIFLHYSCLVFSPFDFLVIIIMLLASTPFRLNKIPLSLKT